jgi:hypothetical protein
MIEPGEHFGGPAKERRIVDHVEGGVVYFHYRLSRREGTATVAEFEAWKAELPDE